MTDLTNFDFLVHCADVWLHLYDTSGGSFVCVSLCKTYLMDYPGN